MKRVYVMALVVFAGCGGDPAPAPAPPTSETTPAEQAAAQPENEMRMKETEFYLYNTAAPVGGTQKPMVTFHVGELVLGQGESDSYAFKNVTATLHVEEKDIVFTAAEGSYKEGERAFLRGGVKAQVDDIRIELEEIEITAPTADTPGMARSEQPVVLAGPGIELVAEGLRLYPEEKRLELGTGSGYLDFGRLQQ